MAIYTAAGIPPKITCNAQQGKLQKNGTEV